MILAIDIGNTTVALGGIKDGRVCFVAHMDTVRTRTAAEYRAEMEKVSNMNADIKDLQDLIQEQDRKFMEKAPALAEERDKAEERGNALWTGSSFPG